MKKKLVVNKGLFLGCNYRAHLRLFFRDMKIYRTRPGKKNKNTQIRRRPFHSWHQTSSYHKPRWIVRQCQLQHPLAKRYETPFGRARRWFFCGRCLSVGGYTPWKIDMASSPENITYMWKRKWKSSIQPSTFLLFWGLQNVNFQECLTILLHLHHTVTLQRISTNG